MLNSLVNFLTSNLNKSSKFKMTHRPQPIKVVIFTRMVPVVARVFCFPGINVSVAACFCFSDGLMYRRTDRQKDVPTSCVKIMTTISAVTRWVSRGNYDGQLRIGKKLLEVQVLQRIEFDLEKAPENSC